MFFLKNRLDVMFGMFYIWLKEKEKIHTQESHSFIVSL